MPHNDNNYGKTFSIYLCYLFSYFLFYLPYQFFYIKEYKVYVSNIVISLNVFFESYAFVFFPECSLFFRFLSRMLEVGLYAPLSIALNVFKFLFDSMPYLFSFFVVSEK